MPIENILYPYGKVASYGQIARLIGSPRSARVVGWALRTLPEDTTVPWQRVINKSGMISIENMDVPKEQQVVQLRAEGIIIEERERNFFVDMEKYGWKK
jgi:methylated-DNA-protein-cysteine methyltransferase-like protein